MDISIVYNAKNIVGESPFWCQNEKSLYWIDIVNKTLNVFNPETQDFKEWFFDDLVCGVVPTSDGKLCIALQHDILLMDPKTNIYKKAFEIESNIPENRINEIKCDSKGRLWIGSMQNNVMDDGSASIITKNSGCLYVNSDAGTFIKVENDVGISNTLAWDESRSLFYFADSQRDLIWRYKFNADTGQISDRQEFFIGQGVGAPDGSAIDVDGYLWNARFGAGCILKIAPNGQVVNNIELPVTNPTSCCFGGDDNSTLYVTSARFNLSNELLEQNENEGAIIAIKTDSKGIGDNSFDMALLPKAVMPPIS